jgi:hypothetical protein
LPAELVEISHPERNSKNSRRLSITAPLSSPQPEDQFVLDFSAPSCQIV